MRDTLQNMAMAVADQLVALWPRQRPSPAVLQQCRIISHRGEHDNRHVHENTLAAFERALSAGVWGIECDLRWTGDAVPVICHDADTKRVFGCDLQVGDVTFAQLREACPSLPTLAEVVDLVAGRGHLMLEVKAQRSITRARGVPLLEQVLAPLTPGRDYHLMALEPALLDWAPAQAAAHCLTIAELNVAAMSAAALSTPHRGLTGHYLLLRPGVRRQHRAAGQALGTGFVRSRNALFRELHLGVDWVFSNHAVQLQQLLEAEIARASAGRTSSD